MRKNRLIFLLQNFIIVIALFIFLLNDKLYAWSHILLLLLIIYNFVKFRNKLFSIIFFYSILLFSTYIPILLVNLNYVLSIINLNTIRSSVLTSEYYSIAGDYIVFGTAILTSYFPFSKPFHFKINIYPRKYLLVLETFIIVLSYLINRNANIILFDNYAGDGYIEGKSFGGWSMFFIVAIAYYIYLTNLENKRNILFVIFILFFWLIFGNRGEIFAIAFFLLIKFVQKKNYIQWKKLLIWGGVSFIVFFGIGIFRSSGHFNFNNVFQSFISDFTGAPVVYTFMATIYHVAHYGYEYGSTFIDYFLRTLPSFITPNRPDDLSRVILNEYSSSGGLHFLAESYLNFGTLGIFFQVHLFSLLFIRVEQNLNFKKTYYYLFIVFIFIATRTVWYGFITLYKVFIFLLIIYILYGFIKKNK